MFRRVIVWLLAVFVVGQGFGLIAPERAQAVGGVIFEIKDDVSPEVIRVDKTTLTVNARLKVTEQGFADVGNETFAFITLKQTLTLQPAGDDKDNDYWKVSKVEFSDLKPESSYGANNSKLLSPQKVDFRNRSNQTVSLVDYSTLPKDIAPEDFLPCYRVLKSNADTAAVEGTSSGCSKIAYNETKRTPAGTIASYTYLFQKKITAGNYDLKDTGGGKYSKATVAGWLGTQDIDGLKIDISEEENKPPTLVVPKSKLGDRPPADLAFKLVATSSEGAIAISGLKWMTYQGYVGTEKVDNLYFLHNDGGNTSGIDSNFYWSTNYAELKKGHVPDRANEEVDGTTELNRAVMSGELQKSIELLFSYVMNVPLNSDGTVGGNNCGQGYTGKKSISITGPKGKKRIPEPDQSKTTEPPTNLKPDEALKLHPNCMNIGSNSWLKYWGVTDSFVSAPGEEPCGIGDIFGQGEIGKIFSKMTQCLFDAIFKPAVEWATNLVIKAAGITYYRPEIGDRWRA